MSESNQDARLERLRTAVGKIRTRGGSGRNERWLMIAGGAGVVIGIPIIFLGWYGASRTPYVFEQLPYVISGGLLGLALAVVGGLFYFSYWATRQIHETRRQSQEAAEALRQIRDLLAAGAMSSASAQPASAQASGNGTYVATAKGTMFHKPDCVVVAGRDDLRQVDPTTKGLEPCRICEPLAVSSKTEHM